MAGADGEHTFMKNSADTDVARLRNNNFWDGGNIDLNPLSWPSLLQHPNSCLELPSPAHILLLSSPIIHETSWAKLSHSRGALMKSTSLSERVWKNNGETEIITLHSALGFNTFLIKVSLAGWITTVIFDALLIKASHAGSEKTLRFIIIFAWDMARGKRCWKSRLTCQLLIWSKLTGIRVFAYWNESRFSPKGPIKKKKSDDSKVAALQVAYVMWNQKGYGDWKGGEGKGVVSV